MEYKRICPECGKEIFYKYKSTKDYAEKKNSLCRNCATYKKSSKERQGDLSILLEDNSESFYWIGFLLADGHFDKNRLSITISYKDIDHLKKFGNYIKYTGEYKIRNCFFNDKEFKECSLDIQDSKIIPLINQKFDINTNKTLNPPKTILKWNRKLILSLFAGFIDGDGSIIKKHNRKDASLKIQIHKSWLNILQEFNTLFDKNFTNINNREYASLNIVDFPYIRKLKKELLKLNLPLLERKWNNIDENYINKIEKGKLIRPLIKQDFKNGLNRKEISIKYNVSYSLLTKILKYDN